MSTSSNSSNFRRLILVFLQIAAMFGLGVGQPLLQLVRENPEFLVVHQSRGWDVIILIAVLFILLPAALSAVVYLAGLVRPRFGLVIQSFILGGLLALILLPVVDNIPIFTGYLTLVVAAIPATVLIFRFPGSNFLRQNLAFLALALPFFIFLFLGSSNIKQIFSSVEPPITSSGQSVNTPVVMIIFDEFPTSSLMGPDQELDCRLFPNFCRLADRSTWYRNATSVSGATLRSVPAIVSGKFPIWIDSPTLANHPENLFTLLGQTHQILAQEILTSLCPDELKSETTPGLSSRLSLLFTDLLVLYQHVVAPEKWRVKLVSVSSKWGHFLESEESFGPGDQPETKMEKFEKYISSLEVGEKPSLVFAHLLLPHAPYVFFPNGKIYCRRTGHTTEPDGTWGEDRVNAAHSYRRHILQVMAVDRLLGELLDRLEELGIYDDSAIIITADHGSSFREGLHRRKFLRGNEADIMRVPLFFKYPGQTIGEINNCLAQSIDIFPTLVSVLGCDPGWEFDGVDLQSKAIDNRTELDFFDQDNRTERKIVPEMMDDMLEIIQWKYDLFGDNGGIERLFKLDDTHGLLGKEIAGLSLADHPSLRGRVHDALELEDVDLSCVFVPAEFNGTINGHDAAGRLNLALALNGEIVGVCRTYSTGPDPHSFNWQITTPLECFRSGSNEAELFLVPDSYPETDLLRIPLSTPSFLGKNIGASRVIGIQEKGLFKPNTWDGCLVRWSNGQASWRIPLKKGEKPKMLTLQIVSSGPPGSYLSISVNDTELLKQVLPRGKWETRLPLGSVNSNHVLTVELDSRIFVPSETNPKSSDNRELSIAISTLIVK